uniref:SRCR domain-containing protein n=1 Tax=Magallana gigas TaxID=29159 RepID=A0A8W8LZJ3_MAGGI|nr:deleted in malignant brain tumors 1 protein-like [Crassostrea gigas]
MSTVSCLIVILTLHLTSVHGLLLDNINNQQKTTPTSSAHQDTLVFLMQEVMQIKNILQQKTKEIDNLRSAVFNETSSMFLNLTRELQTLKNGSNSSNDILKLSNEIAVLKFTVENELANHFQTLSGTNMTDMFAKLTNIENTVRHFTLVLNQKVSTSELVAVEQRLTTLSTQKVSTSDLTQALTQKVSTSELAAVEQRLTTLSTKLDAQIKNITESVIALQQGNIIPGRIRLVNGSTPWMGRVEVSYQGTWATVSSRSYSHGQTFDDKAAEVVCRMLGYPTKNAAAIYENSPLYFGKGTGYIDTSLYDLHCNGDENSLYDCPHNPEDSSPFHTHRYDVGVACMDIRLVGGSSPMNGRVEVNFGEGWGTVCDDGWDNNEARVVCRMLGYHGSAQGLQGSSTTGGHGFILLDGLLCTGSETSLATCPRSVEIGRHACTHVEDARAVCHN